MTSPALKEIVAEMREHVASRRHLWATEQEATIRVWASEIERAASLTAREREEIEKPWRAAMHEIIRMCQGGPEYETLRHWCRTTPALMAVTEIEPPGFIRLRALLEGPTHG